MTLRETLAAALNDEAMERIQSSAEAAADETRRGKTASLWRYSERLVWRGEVLDALLPVVEADRNNLRAEISNLSAETLMLRSELAARDARIAKFQAEADEDVVTFKAVADKLAASEARIAKVLAWCEPAQHDGPLVRVAKMRVLELLTEAGQ